MKKIAIIIKWVSHYRKPFYEELKKELKMSGVDVSLYYGEPLSHADRKKKDWVDIDWGRKVENKRILNSELIFQPVLPNIKNYDLIIVEHANKLLINYLLQFKRLFNKQKIAFWGHGRNFQSSKNCISILKEKWKLLMMFQVDWWFAYNSLCADEIESRGFPSSKVTRVENAIDTNQLIKLSDTLNEKDISEYKRRLGIISNKVGVFVGGMFETKRLPFLIDAAIEVKKKVPDFELIFIGGGIDEDVVKIAADKYAWIHCMGPLFGKEKIMAMRSANVFLMPGLVGLGILDAFALGLPVITTNYEYHSPEISYVENGENGVISQNSKMEFAQSVTQLFMDDKFMEKLKSGCARTATKYTIENMVKNFSQGIIKCLSI